MASYDTLTSLEKVKLDILTNNLRSWHGELSQLLQRAGAIRDYYQANSLNLVMPQISPGTELIPNASGLADAADLTKGDVVELVDVMSEMLTDLSDRTSGLDQPSDRILRVKAAGINASL